MHATWTKSYDKPRHHIKKQRPHFADKGPHSQSYGFSRSHVPMGFPNISVGKESACNAGDPGSIPGSGISTGDEIGYPCQYSWASLVAQLVKNPPTMQETLAQFLGREVPWRRDRLPTPVFLGFPCGSDGKESTCSAGDLCSISGLGSSPGEGTGYPLQYSWASLVAQMVKNSSAMQETWV